MSIDTPARLLRLLVLFSSRPQWSAGELVDRLEVTDRTLRRDVTRLRDLGYPIESLPGRYGGYRLGAGGRLPPLLLDDDEAVAVSVALRDLSSAADAQLGEAALAALTKLAQVLPSALRERVDTLAEVSVRLGRPGPAGPERTDASTLMALAQSCRRGERVRFDYRTGDDRTSRRHVEPHRLVSLRSRWYLVAFDLDRDDWRTFRIDRVGPPAATGARSADRPAPDAAALVAEGVAVRVYDTHARVHLPVPAAMAAREIPATVAIIEPDGDDACVATIGGDPDWIARYVASLPFDVDLDDSPEVRKELDLLATRLQATATRHSRF